MLDDAQLLRQYAENRSEEAFTELVRRHLGWVYRAGLRRTGGRSDLAQDVAQYVFTVLAQKARSLSQREALAGWLYTTARYAASQLVRSEVRRRNHEAAAATMNLPDELPNENWEELRPVLDQVLDRVSAREREALFLRFFEGKSFAEIGKLLRLGEDGARKRVERALERLSAHLSRRGINSSSAAVVSLLTAEGALAAPPQVLTATTLSALAGAVPAGSSAGLIHLMTATKTTWMGAAFVGLAGIIGLSTATVALYEVRKASAEKTAAAAAMSQYQSDQQKLSAAERNAAAAENKVATLKAKFDASLQAGAMSTQNSGAGKGGQARQQREEGQAFLQTFGQAKPLLTEIGKAQIRQSNAVFFKQAGLTAAQIDAFETQTAQHWLDTLLVSPTAIHPGEADLPDDQLKGILGDSGLQAYKDYERTRPAQNWASSLAKTAAEGGVPLSVDQISMLAQAVTNNSPDYASGQTVKPMSVDWTSAVTQAKQSLTEAQWEQVQSAILMQQVMRQAMAIAQKKGN